MRFANPPASRQSKLKPQTSERQDSPVWPPNPASILLHVVVALGAARQHVGERGRRQTHPLDHVGCIRKSVCMRIISRPQDIFRTDIFGKILERSFHRFERDKTLTTENIT